VPRDFKPDGVRLTPWAMSGDTSSRASRHGPMWRGTCSRRSRTGPSSLDVRCTVLTTAGEMAAIWAEALPHVRRGIGYSSYNGGPNVGGHRDHVVNSPTLGETVDRESAHPCVSGPGAHRGQTERKLLLTATGFRRRERLRVEWIPMCNERSQAACAAGRGPRGRARTVTGRGRTAAGGARFVYSMTERSGQTPEAGYGERPYGPRPAAALQYDRHGRHSGLCATQRSSTGTRRGSNRRVGGFAGAAQPGPDDLSGTPRSTRPSRAKGVGSCWATRPPTACVARGERVVAECPFIAGTSRGPRVIGSPREAEPGSKVFLRPGAPR